MMTVVTFFDLWYSDNQYIGDFRSSVLMTHEMSGVLLSHDFRKVERLRELNGPHVRLFRALLEFLQL
jgi:serine/threonine-protein kinase RIO1